MIDPYCYAWADRFREAAAELRSMLGVPVRHVGSTAVQGLAAKPIIDMVAFLPSWGRLDERLEDLARAGWSIVERGSGTDLRVFLERNDSEHSVGLHLHLVPIGSAYGRAMIDFREALARSPARRVSYVTLKRELAERHPFDVTGYTNGKGGFIHRVLDRVCDPYSIDQLLTHQRAELNEAQKYQNMVVAIQAAITAIAVGSVFLSNNADLLDLALAGIGLVGVWVFTAYHQRKHRALGDQARRVALLRSGLDARISPAEITQLFQSFAAAVRPVHHQTEDDYFESREPPGPCRLLELIAESAFWTEDIHRASASIVVTVLFVLVAVPLLAFWAVFAELPTDTEITFARVLIALFVFVLSADVVGTAIGHMQSSAAIGRIRQRLPAIEAAGFPMGDVQLLLIDYNSIVEGAPVTPPLVYRIRHGRLSRRWADYLKSRAHVGARSKLEERASG